MTIVIWGIVAALCTLGIWAIILALFARVDRPHLERERMKLVFDETAGPTSNREAE